MTIGPVEYLVIRFPGSRFSGAMVPALRELIERRTVRLLDLVFILRGPEGDVIAVEVDEDAELRAFVDLDGEVGGLRSEADIAHAAKALQPGSAAALLVWEDLWAAPLADALRASGGEVVEGGRVPHDLIEPAVAGLPPT